MKEEAKQSIKLIIMQIINLNNIKEVGLRENCISGCYKHICDEIKKDKKNALFLECNYIAKLNNFINIVHEANLLNEANVEMLLDIIIRDDGSGMFRSHEFLYNKFGELIDKDYNLDSSALCIASKYIKVDIATCWNTMRVHDLLDYLIKNKKEINGDDANKIIIAAIDRFKNKNNSLDEISVDEILNKVLCVKKVIGADKIAEIIKAQDAKFLADTIKHMYDKDKSKDKSLVRSNIDKLIDIANDGTKCIIPISAYVEYYFDGNAELLNCIINKKNVHITSIVNIIKRMGLNDNTVLKVINLTTLEEIDDLFLAIGEIARQSKIFDYGNTKYVFYRGTRSQIEKMLPSNVFIKIQSRNWRQVDKYIEALNLLKKNNVTINKSVIEKIINHDNFDTLHGVLKQSNNLTNDSFDKLCEATSYDCYNKLEKELCISYISDDVFLNLDRAKEIAEKIKENFKNHSEIIRLSLKHLGDRNSDLIYTLFDRLKSIGIDNENINDLAVALYRNFYDIQKLVDVFQLFLDKKLEKKLVGNVVNHITLNIINGEQAHTLHVDNILKKITNLGDVNKLESEIVECVVLDSKYEREAVELLLDIDDSEEKALLTKDNIYEVAKKIRSAGQLFDDDDKKVIEVLNFYKNNKQAVLSNKCFDRILIDTNFCSIVKNLNENDNLQFAESILGISDDDSENLANLIANSKNYKKFNKLLSKNACEKVIFIKNTQVNNKYIEAMWQLISNDPFGDCNLLTETNYNKIIKSSNYKHIFTIINVLFCTSTLNKDSLKEVLWLAKDNDKIENVANTLNNALNNYSRFSFYYKHNRISFNFIDKNVKKIHFCNGTKYFFFNNNVLQECCGVFNEATRVKQPKKVNDVFERLNRLAPYDNASIFTEVGEYVKDNEGFTDELYAALWLIEKIWNKLHGDKSFDDDIVKKLSGLLNANDKKENCAKLLSDILKTKPNNNADFDFEKLFVDEKEEISEKEESIIKDIMNQTNSSSEQGAFAINN